MNQSVSALGSVVRATRKSKNLSQEALAEKLGVCKRTIIDIEKNTGNPKFEIVKDIKAVYTKEQLSGEGIVVKRGKKNFRRVVVK